MVKISSYEIVLYSYKQLIPKTISLLKSNGTTADKRHLTSVEEIKVKTRFTSRCQVHNNNNNNNNGVREEQEN
jgi:hypothetical protein